MSPIATASASTGVLVVRQGKTDSGWYTEGAVAFLEVRDESGQAVSVTQTADYHLDIEVLRTDLEPGHYTLGTYVRPCEAACPAMGAPTDQCSLELMIEPGVTTQVMIERRLGRPCSASLVDG